MIGRKTILPPQQTPETQQEEIDRLEEKKAKLETEIEQKELPDLPEMVTTEQVLNALNELYTIFSNRFDQLYYKIDQTQDLILMKSKEKKTNKK